jgi:hypothetical protein
MIAASIGCIFAHSLPQLLVFRPFQGADASGDVDEKHPAPTRDSENHSADNGAKSQAVPKTYN